MAHRGACSLRPKGLVARLLEAAPDRLQRAPMVKRSSRACRARLPLYKRLQTKITDNARAHLVRLHTVAVKLHLVHPVGAGRHTLGRHGAAGCYETELGHGLTM